MWLGDYAEDYATLNFAFTTRTTAGVPFALANTPVIAIYKGSATGTEKTSAESYITLSVDFDSIVGLNNVLIDLSGDAFFAVGEDYKVVITTGTVNSVSVVGETVASFSIENRSVNAQVTTIASDLVLAQADLDTLTSDTAAIELDTGTTLSAQITTIASDLILAQVDLDTLTSDTAAIEIDTGTTLSAQITTIASDLILAQVDLDTLTSDTAAIETDTGTTLSAQITTIASDLILAQVDLDTLTSDTAAIEEDTGTTLSAQITTIASDIVLIYSDTTIIESDTVVIEAGVKIQDVRSLAWAISRLLPPLQPRQ